MTSDRCDKVRPWVEVDTGGDRFEGEADGYQTHVMQVPGGCLVRVTAFTKKGYEWSVLERSVAVTYVPELRVDDFRVIGNKRA